MSGNAAPLFLFSHICQIISYKTAPLPSRSICLMFWRLTQLCHSRPCQPWQPISQQLSSVSREPSSQLQVGLMKRQPSAFEANLQPSNQNLLQYASHGDTRREGLHEKIFYPLYDMNGGIPRSRGHAPLFSKMITCSSDS